MTLTPWEIYRRAETGPLLEESEFDKRILPNRAMELVKEYGIKYDPEQVVPSDDSLADDVWKAAVSLFLDVGVYCVDTKRIVKVTDDELKEILRDKALGQLFLGEGRDARMLVKRGIEDRRPALVKMCPVAAPVSESLIPRLMQAYLQYQLDFITSPTVPEFEGRPVKVGSPVEVMATMQEVSWTREAAKRAGKPGIHIRGGNTGVTATAAIAAFHPDGLRKTDSLVCDLLAELKTDFRILTKEAYSMVHGALLSPVACPLVGSVGGPDVTALVGLAEVLQQITHFYSRGTYVSDIVTDMRYPCTSRRGCLWASNVVAMAVSRNAPFVIGTDALLAAGPCTDMALYEMSAKAIGDVVSGRSWTSGAGTCGGAKRDYLSPLEPLIITELNQAVAGMKRADANEIVKKLLLKYEQKIPNPPIGKSFTECYDIKTLEPSKECVEVYARVKSELDDLGIAFKS